MLFYVAITAGGATLPTGALVVAVLERGFVTHAVPAFRALGLLAAAGTAGLLLDYTNGHVRLVQLFVYVALVLALVRLVRLSAATSPVSGSRG